jgi:23S rRNA pseudouridine1911/1915/1917 synthase
MKWTERFEVAQNYDGWRLDRYLTDQLKRATRSKVARIIKANTRFADGRRVKAGAIVRTGDVVLIDRTEVIDQETPQLERVLVRSEVDGLVVLEKPAGMLVHRTAHEVSRTIDAFPTSRFPGEQVDPLHRLDRDTSGLLLCGRGIDAIRIAKSLFEESEPTKTYLARAWDPQELWRVGKRERIDDPLGFDSTSSVRLRMGRGELSCATHVHVVERDESTALLEVRIDRGRQHQIRAHLSMYGTPIVGDKLYQMGDEFFLEWLKAPGAEPLVDQLASRWHCLHAWRLELKWRGASLRFESAAPSWVSELPPSHDALR